MENLHTHTTFSDGAATPREMIEAALAAGYTKLGISDHSFTPFDPDYCAGMQDVQAYVKEVTALAREYKGRIQVLCGIEQDATSASVPQGLDFAICSVHYVEVDPSFADVDGCFLYDDAGTSRCYAAVDLSEESFCAIVQACFNGDYLAFAEAYFATVATWGAKLTATLSAGRKTGWGRGAKTVMAIDCNPNGNALATPVVVMDCKPGWGRNAKTVMAMDLGANRNSTMTPVVAMGSKPSWGKNATTVMAADLGTNGNANVSPYLVMDCKPIWGKSTASSATSNFIIGHFDLISKYNAGNRYFNEDDPRYQAAWQKAADALLKTGLPFEVNYAPVISGKKSQPYPCAFIRTYLTAHDATLIPTADAHSIAALQAFATEVTW